MTEEENTRANPICLYCLEVLDNIEEGQDFAVYECLDCGIYIEVKPITD